MGENTVFLLLTALIRNFYKFIMERLDVKKFGFKETSRIKAFVFRFISVPAKNLWSCYCVLPQDAWWGKGNVYAFMVTFAALCPLFTNDADSFRFCIILGA